MKNKSFHFVLLVAVGLAGCYTSLRHPYVADDVDNPTFHPETQTDASCNSCHRSGNRPSASIPMSKLENFRWQYYYDSAWWQDEFNLRAADGSALAPEPTDFRNRFPNEYGGSSANTGSMASPTYVAPTLSKKAGDDKPDDEGAEKKDPRRGFDRRADEKKPEGESRNQVERQPKR